MPLHEFVFELRMDDRADAGELVDEVSAEILQRLGYADGPAGDIALPLRRAVEDRRRACVVLFEAAHGQLAITVTSDAQPPWRLARPIP